MPDSGIVRSWNSDEGWGVVDVADVDDGIWVHFSSIEGRPFGFLNVGEPVTVDWEPVEHSPYPAQATRVIVATNDEPADDQASSNALNSILTIEWDADGKE